MKRQMRITDDPVVAEIRAIRARIWPKADGTGEGLMRLLRDAKAELPPLRRKRRRSSSASRYRAATPGPTTIVKGQSPRFPFHEHLPARLALSRARFKTNSNASALGRCAGHNQRSKQALFV